MKSVFSGKKLGVSIGLVLLVLVCTGAAFFWWPQESALTQCAAARYKESCYDDIIRKTLHAKGLTAAFDVLAEVYSGDPDFFSTCHAETHVIGEAAYEEFHATGEVELTDKASYCGYGFYHGFMDALLYETKDYDEARDFCAYAGDQIPVPTGYTEGACYHGIGHGVTDGTDPRLWGNPVRMAAPGLHLCELVAGGNSDHLMRCASGVFNSLALQYRDPQYGLRTTDAFSVCHEGNYTGPVAEACYSQMNTLATFLARYDFTTAIRSTLQIQDAHNRREAIKGVSETYFSTANSLHKPLSAREVSGACALLGEDAPICITGVVSGIQEFGTPGEEYKDMLAFCALEGMDADFVPQCYRAVVDSTRWFYGEEEVPYVCAKIPELHRPQGCQA